jgi:hypothetical protein
MCEIASELRLSQVAATTGICAASAGKKDTIDHALYIASGSEVTGGWWLAAGGDT